MKYVIAFVTLFTIVIAAPLDNSQNAQIIRQDLDNIGVDGYKFAYETSDGVTREEQGELRNAGTDNEAISVRGSYSWVADDGQTYTVTFLADENGFQPEGAHLPKA
ncbi:endocuticle structural glycoprotein SgAbd-5-like [Condylostylus longicornis]|uniref:endocuticle structural glycoprotein SgAbd-5-like n=1 Tax=Condylostylus longicornis TaxID=2530218 RepID=UPI00244E1056|nr:endocuticle structural glycoprotein SgAbd-5-like [Condylostylus longicornis]